ncbi:MAG: hypothetical protein CME62_13490 [Halobacteriovoraceae bacterium]|nr:hypothetical protein [Halobacteriovoraceae bacterium]
MKFLTCNLFISSLFFFFVLTSCGDNRGELYFEERNVFEQSLLEEDVELNFKTLQREILAPNCMECHSGVNAKPSNDPINFDSYEKMMKDRFIPLLVKGNPQKSRLYESVESGAMPINGRLKQYEIDYIKDWISACAPEFSDETYNCDDEY